MHAGPLIAILVAGFVLAFAMGALAHKLRVSPLIGYLLAGVVIGPFTPGFVADQGLANELAEIGVILLMFGVGLHFSLKDLLSVKTVAVPGAVVQIGIATALGVGLGMALGWTLMAGIIFGLALSVASTVVLLRALQERRLVQTERGRIAVGWLIVEDLAMVLALVIIPGLAGAMNGESAGTGPFGLGLGGVLLVTLGKVAAFVAVMLIVGRRVIPWILHWVAHTGSRELFRLSVLAIALGVAFGAAALFGVSFALGAFFAGMILNESPLSQRAAEETLPLRDAFAVLFFVSVGMLFNPSIIVSAPWELAATLAIILVGKSAAAFGLVRAFGRSNATALTISASLAQIGEFSFILAGLGVGMGLLPEVARDLILAGAIISIFVNPLLFALIARFAPLEEPKPKPVPAEEPAVEPDSALIAKPAPEPAPEPALPEYDLPQVTLSGHTILIGYGRVGAFVGAGLKEAGMPFVVVEDRPEPAEAARADGAEVVFGNAADPAVLTATNVAEARRLVVAIPETFEAGTVVEQARAANAGLDILARAHSDTEVEHLEKCGATHSIMGEREIARCMLSLVLDKTDPGSESRASAAE
ncbi:cation:proton antiporter domain-containing protein [Azospirillum rugosum]|uniref:CPA2 family monovalent cation:H+ antiporter-2 n=1 Tax=Azospirillum rugosum TaxID=416170 RepID=A0ABS4SEF0_9PROT|nr:cation:proton antiporter [Azospirillum rugosum]MBP2290953.1 CPA2 family monovalent cation:H+ antiporter-2 [Azospirillum rugosum]MDQ0524983.1 CPA2 family monovalent cation:H+ antiporter-2 [Azospirillum rugosum]